MWIWTSISILPYILTQLIKLLINYISLPLSILPTQQVATITIIYLVNIINSFP